MERMRTLLIGLALAICFVLLSIGSVSALEGIRDQRALTRATGAVRCLGKPATIVVGFRPVRGTKGPDVIVGSWGPDRISGRGGNDLICGRGGRDRIDGDRGKDLLTGKTGADLLRGGRGSDELYGGRGSDRVAGASGNDEAQGGDGDRDRVDGGPGDDLVGGGDGDHDLVIGGVGSDRVNGGPGDHDTVSYLSAGGSIAVDLQNGQVSGAETETLAGVEDVLGGSGDDTIVAATGTPNRLDGGPGDDKLLGTTPADQAFGGPGADVCIGTFELTESCGLGGEAAGTQVELYEGLAEAPILAVSGADEANEVGVSLEGGNYVIASDTGVTAVPATGADIVADLGAGDDTLLIDASIPTTVSVSVDGGAGSDWIRGGEGRDVLYAGDDGLPDRLEGGGGDDVLFGVNIAHPRRDGGVATMVGGAGNDLLVGGQPCDGDLFAGGPGRHDSASFARVRNEGTFVRATIGGSVIDPDVPGCEAGRIGPGVEKIEGSPGADRLLGSGRDETILGRGGQDFIDGRGGDDRCIGGGGGTVVARCEIVRR